MSVRLVAQLLGFLAVSPAFAGAPLPLPLNDSGLEICYDDSAPISCFTTDAYTRQDARFGRDAAAAHGALPKVGAGSAGFDFTKIANDGSDLPPDAALGDAPGDWACTRDNFTGLVWEVKTDDGGLRDKDWLYTWYYADATDNGGDPGITGGDTCGGTLGIECNSDAFAAAVNSTSPFPRPRTVSTTSASSARSTKRSSVAAESGPRTSSFVSTSACVASLKPWVSGKLTKTVSSSRATAIVPLATTRHTTRLASTPPRCRLRICDQLRENCKGRSPEVPATALGSLCLRQGCECRAYSIDQSVKTVSLRL